MRNMKNLILSTSLAAVLVACGGSSSDKLTFSSMVNFGDSLSDVGSYKVGTVAALGGGMYTVNSATTKNWTQILATQMGLNEPCPYQTGLDGDASKGFSVPVAYNKNCKSYAQGGARVTNPVGPGNKLLGGDNATLGQTTVPLVTQVANHLGVAGGRFTGSELVTVMAGGNDAIIQTGTYTATVAAAAASGGASAAASAAPAAAAAAVAAMTTAGTELANLVKNEVLAKGAAYVVVVNLPNVAMTPYGALNEAGLPGTKAVIDAMVKAFNSALASGVSNVAGVKLVDAYATSSAQVATPAAFGLSNVTSTACDLTAASNPLGSSLTCNTDNVVTGDVSRYMFADQVHPTPYGYELVAKEVAKVLGAAGWM